MSLNFANNDIQIRLQFLKRLHTNGLHLGANLNSFDYTFVEYSRFNTPSISAGNYQLGTSTSEGTTYYLGDIQFQCKQSSSTGVFLLWLNGDRNWDHSFSANDRGLWNFNINNMLFDQMDIEDISGFRIYFHFVGVKITMKN